jgi:uncharacterized membrane protein
MNKQRIEIFTDGVFAIIMTLLIIEIKVPELHDYSSNELVKELRNLIPLFLSFFLSFAMIVNYWTTHHFMITVLAQNINRKLAYINFLFLAFVCITPFSSRLLGLYPFSKVSIVFYSCNVLIITSLAAFMRFYIYSSDQIENKIFDSLDTLYGHVRIAINIFFPVLAILVSFFNIKSSIFLLVAPVIINLIPGFIAFSLKLTKLDKLLLPYI